MNYLTRVLLLIMCLGLFACLDDGGDDYDDGDDYSSDTGGGGNSGGSYDWSYSCPGGYGGGGTVPIPRGSCETAYKNYAQAWGCNQVDDFNSTACDLENCTGEPKGCGAY